MHSAKWVSPRNNRSDSSSSRKVHGAIKLLTQLRRTVASNTFSMDKDSSDDSDTEETATSKQQRPRLANPPSVPAVPMLDVGDAFGYGRDRRDSSGKTFQVVVPKKLLLWVGVVFFGLPIFLFLYVEGTRYYLVKNNTYVDNVGFQEKVANNATNTISTITEQGKQPHDENNHIISSSTTITEHKQENPVIPTNVATASKIIVTDTSKNDSNYGLAEETDEVSLEDEVQTENNDNETLVERRRR
jgi:hypothetical protein